MPCTRPVGCPHTGHCTGSSRVRARTQTNSPSNILDDQRRESRKHHARKLVDVSHATPTMTVTLRYHRLRDGAARFTDPRREKVVVARARAAVHGGGAVWWILYGQQPEAEADELGEDVIGRDRGIKPRARQWPAQS